MVRIRFIWCLVWFLYYSSFRAFAAQNLVSEKYPRHDKNWWFWNQEAKEKLTTIDHSQKKGEKESKRSVQPFARDIGLFRSFLSKEPLTHHVNKKRWLSGTFGFCGKKNQHRESRKWQIDSQRSGSNIVSFTPAIQNPWTLQHKKIIEAHNGDYETNISLRKLSAGSRVNVLRRHKSHPKKISVHHPNSDHNREVNADNLLFGSSNRAVINKESPLSRGQQPIPQFPEESMILYDSQTRLPARYQQVWNKSHDPVWDRFMTPFEELKFNPLKRPYPFHDIRSSIRWYTTPPHGLIKTSEPPIEEGEVRNGQQLFPPDRLGIGDSNEILESKGVARSKDKTDKEPIERIHSKYTLMPKVYALNHLRSGMKIYNDHNGLLADSVTNPIIVPGFKHKYNDALHTLAPGQVQVNQRPYIIHSEEREDPFEEEFIQVSRANRNQTKNILGVNDNKQATPNAIPVQIPSPYAFPGGVNISILVPNPPIPSPSPETPLSTMTSTSTDKNIKKKKERKKKVKNHEELNEVLFCEPRSLASAGVHVRKFPYAEKTGINPLIGEDDRRVSKINLNNCRTQPNNDMAIMKQMMSDSKTENLDLLSHIGNLTMSQLDWDTKSLGINMDKMKKPTVYSRDDDDEDDICMLNDEHTPSATTIRSEEKQQAASFSWYKFTDYVPRRHSVQDAREPEKFNNPTDINKIPRLEYRQSGRAEPGKKDVEYYIENDTRNERTLSLRSKIRSNKQEDGGIKQNKYGVPLSMAGVENPNGNELLDSRVLDGQPRDQWDALDEDLKNGISVNGKPGDWRARNKKRETDYYDHQQNDEQGYYRLSVDGNSFRNPAKLILSAFRAKSNKAREREYYDDIPEERLREQMRPIDVVPSDYPK